MSVSRSFPEGEQFRLLALLGTERALLVGILIHIYVLVGRFIILLSGHMADTQSTVTQPTPNPAPWRLHRYTGRVE